MSSRLGFAVATLLLPLAAARADDYVGKEFPNFSAKDAVTGDSINLKDLRGRFVLVDFWATW